MGVGGVGWGYLVLRVLTTGWVYASDGPNLYLSLVGLAPVSIIRSREGNYANRTPLQKDLTVQVSNKGVRGYANGCFA